MRTWQGKLTQGVFTLSFQYILHLGLTERIADIFYFLLNIWLNHFFFYTSTVAASPHTKKKYFNICTTDIPNTSNFHNVFSQRECVWMWGTSSSCASPGLLWSPPEECSACSPHVSQVQRAAVSTAPLNYYNLTLLNVANIEPYFYHEGMGWSVWVKGCQMRGKYRIYF